MPLLGQGAVVVFSDMSDPPAHDHWHSHEHLRERLGIPGFLRARRCVAAQPGVPLYLVIYEVAAIDVMISPPYLDRLNNPTAWTTRTMASVKSLSRTLTRVVASFGQGVGAEMLSIGLSATPGAETQLRGWLVDEALPKIVAAPGMIGAHLLQRDDTVVRPNTAEENLRGRTDAIADWIVLVEGYSASQIDEVANVDLAVAQLVAHGARDPTRARYRVAHVMTSDDLGDAPA